MSRSAPSAAVLAVVDELRTSGVELSERQIESLQAKGVLPKGEHVHDGGGGSRVVLPDDFLVRAHAAASLPTRRRSAANVAAVMYVSGEEITEADAALIGQRARELLDEMVKSLDDKESMRNQLRSSRSPAVRRNRRLTRSRLAVDAGLHDEAPPNVNDVLAFELHSVGGLLAGDEDVEVDETLVATTMLDRAVAAIVHGVLGELGGMLRTVGGAAELVTVEALDRTRWIWKVLVPKATIQRASSMDPDSLVCAIATVVGIRARESQPWT